MRKILHLPFASNPGLVSSTPGQAPVLRSSGDLARGPAERGETGKPENGLPPRARQW